MIESEYKTIESKEKAKMTDDEFRIWDKGWRTNANSEGIKISNIFQTQKELNKVSNTAEQILILMLKRLKLEKR